MDLLVSRTRNWDCDIFDNDSPSSNSQKSYFRSLDIWRNRMGVFRCLLDLAFRLTIIDAGDWLAFDDVRFHNGDSE